MKYVKKGKKKGINKQQTYEKKTIKASTPRQHEHENQK